ncbi:MAG TPA: PilZ domain-containing protein [Polyangiaceae bacterium]
MQEKRLHLRVPTQIEVRWQLGTDTPVEGVASDISLGGMFIVAQAAPPFGAQIVVECTSPSGEPMKLPAVARWNKPGGFGVQFGLLGAKETHFLAQLLRH